MTPGSSGQEMNVGIIDKIANLHVSCPGCKIEVDGGINPDTARQAHNAGATILVSAGYIFSKPDTSTAIKELQGND